jgi:hypothetical protein
MLKNVKKTVKMNAFKIKKSPGRGKTGGGKGHKSRKRGFTGL